MRSTTTLATGRPARRGIALGTRVLTRRITVLVSRLPASRTLRVLATLAAAMLLGQAQAGAQAPRAPGAPFIRPEVRVDYLASPDAIQAGAGAAIRVSTYLRLALVGGVGRHLSDHGDRTSWRAEIIGRFHVDPFRERRWAPYAAGGISVRGAGDEEAEYLVILFGMEGPIVRGWSPAMEVGLGGGARVGIALRRSGPRYR